MPYSYEEKKYLVRVDGRSVCLASIIPLIFFAFRLLYSLEAECAKKSGKPDSGLSCERSRKNEHSVPAEWQWANIWRAKPHYIRQSAKKRNSNIIEKGNMISLIAKHNFYCVRWNEHWKVDDTSNRIHRDKTIFSSSSVLIECSHFYSSSVFERSRLWNYSRGIWLYCAQEHFCCIGKGIERNEDDYRREEKKRTEATADEQHRNEREQYFMIF